MTDNIERKFIPSYILMFSVTAVAAPYLSILIRDLGYSPSWIGILLGISEAAGISGPFLFGFWVDKTGNYRASLVVSCIMPAFAIIPLVTWIHPVVSAVFLALLAASSRSCISMLDAITTIQIGKSGNYGRIRVWGSISFIVVSLMLQWTPFFKPVNAGNISLWMIAISVLAVIPFLLLPSALLKTSVIKRTNDTDSEDSNSQNKDPDEKNISLFSTYALCGFGIIFLSRVAMSIAYTYFPLYVTEILNWNMLGILVALAAVAEVPMFFISSRLIRRFGPIPLMVLSSIGIVVRLLIWAFLPYKSIIIFSQLLHSLCYGIFHPTAVYFVSSVFSAKNRGTGMSIYMAVGMGLPSLIGNMLGGVIIDTAGYKTLFIIYAFIAAASALVGGFTRFSESGK